MRLRRTLIGVALLAFALGCRERQTPAPPPAGVVLGPENIAVVEHGRVETGPVVSGSLEPKGRAAMIAEAGGSVEAAPVELGERVQRGALLARIAARALDNALVSAQAALAARRQSLALAERQLARTRRLVEAGALPERDLELAGSTLASEQAQLAQAQAQLASTRELRDGAVVRAPFDGVVSEKSVHQGDVVTIGAPLVTIIDPSSMRLRANVPSEALAALRIGAPVSFRVRGLGAQEFTGSIERIGAAADPVTRQIPLLVSLPNPSGRLVAGLFAEGRIAVEQREGLVLPAGALTRAGDSISVRRLLDDRVEVVGVEIGLEDPASERVLVTRGLSQGDRVLTGPAKDLADDTLVRIAGAPG